MLIGMSGLKHGYNSNRMQESPPNHMQHRAVVLFGRGAHACMYVDHMTMWPIALLNGLHETEGGCNNAWGNWAFLRISECSIYGVVWRTCARHIRWRLTKGLQCTRGWGGWTTGRRWWKTAGWHSKLFYASPNLSLCSCIICLVPALHP